MNSLVDLIGKYDIFLIAGPCVIETEEITFEIAKKLKEITKKTNIPFIFKASYDKANRTSIKSYRGPGVKKGMEIMKKIKERLNIPILVDVHRIDELEEVSKITDVIQIPAFLCRQTDLIVESAKTSKFINVKKGQFLSPWEMKNIIEKIESTGNRKIMLTERGTCFGYNNLIVDFRSIVIMKKFGYPVIFDATHSLQLPGAGGDKTKGQAEFIPYLARAAVAVGIDGLFLEVHPEPEKALCDAENTLKLEFLEKLIYDVKKINKVVKSILPIK